MMLQKIALLSIPNMLVDNGQQMYECFIFHICLFIPWPKSLCRTRKRKLFTTGTDLNAQKLQLSKKIEAFNRKQQNEGLLTCWSLFNNHLDIQHFP